MAEAVALKKRHFPHEENEMKRSNRWIAIGALVALVGAGAAWGVTAGEDETSMLGHIRHRIGRFMEFRAKLGITQEQREALGNILVENRDAITPVAKDIVAKRRALRELVLADSPDEVAIRKAALDLGRSIGDAAVLAAEVKDEVKAVLTEEQQKLILERIESRQSRVEKALEVFAAMPEDAKPLEYMRAQMGRGPGRGHGHGACRRDGEGARQGKPRGECLGQSKGEGKGQGKAQRQSECKGDCKRDRKAGGTDGAAEASSAPSTKPDATNPGAAE